MRLWPRRRIYVDDLPKTHDVRFLVLFVVLFVAALAAIYGAGYWVAGDKVPARTTIAGVHVGGLSRDEAAAKLEQELAPRLHDPISAASGNQQFSIRPEKVGIDLDVSATLDRAMGGADWDPRHMVRVAIGGSDVEPVLQTREAVFKKAMRPIAKELRTKPENASVTFEGGKPEVQEAGAGTALDLEKTAQRLGEAAIKGNDRVKLPLRPARPTITVDDAESFVRNVADPALDGPVKIEVGDSTVTLEPSVYGPALRATSHVGDLSLGIDAEELQKRSEDVLAEHLKNPTDARLDFEDGHPVVVSSKPGTTVDRTEWAEAVLRATSRQSRHATVKVHQVEPEITTSEIKKLDVKDKIASFQIGLSSNDAYLPGLEKATQQLDGAVIRPGQKFSFLDRVDSFLDSETLSVLATATYDAALHAGMVPVEAATPTYHDPQLPAGLDVAVRSSKSQDAQDLVLRNEADSGVYVHATMKRDGDTGTLRVELWGSKQWDVTIETSDRQEVKQPPTEHKTGRKCRPREGWPGFEIDMTQTVSDDGTTVRTVSLHSSYEPRSQIVCERNS